MVRPKTLPQPPLRTRRLFFLLLLLIATLASTAAETETIAEQCLSSKSSTSRNYYHLVVLIHGYMGSDREQEYLGEALIAQGKKSIQLRSGSNDNNGDDGSCRHNQHQHQFVILFSKANVNNSTDGIAKGGQRLAAEISDWIQQHTDEVQSSSNSNSTIMTLSLVGNSLGGLYSRYALAELYNNEQHQQQQQHGLTFDNNKILPLIFCTTSSPHLGVSQETFVELPKWIEPYVATAMQQQTMNDLFGTHNSTVVMDMCHSTSNSAAAADSLKNNNNRDYLYPLQQFRKRIAVANAYNTDFLVSVSSAAFLSSDSNSVHHHQDHDTTTATTTRFMKHMEHVALQVTTPTTTRDDEDDNDNQNSSTCVNSLDRLGWHKIFMDTRTILPTWFQFSTPKLKNQLSYTSKELQTQFKRYGTLLPIAHPLNMANSRTGWYRSMTKSGQPIMDALAELLILDMIELSEKQQT